MRLRGACSTDPPLPWRTVWVHSEGVSPPGNSGQLTTLRTLRQELVHPKDSVPANRRMGVLYSIPCAQCPHIYIGQTGRSLDCCLREHRWALKNGNLLWCLLLPCIVLVWPPGWFVQGHGDWCAPPHPNSLHARVLAHPTPAGSTQQRQGYSARTLRCTVGLTHTLWVVVLPLFVLLY